VYLTMTNRALEASTVKFPLVRHAVDEGKAFVSEAEVIRP